MLKFEVPYLRFYGQKKLEKPKELRGIKQSFSVAHIRGRCTSQVFIVEDDLWIKHNDYFSSANKVSGRGLPLNAQLEILGLKPKSKKFLYEDCWGSVINRNQAYIHISNVVNLTLNTRNYFKISGEITRLQERYHNFEEYSLECSDMQKLWEEMLKKLKNKEEEIR